MILGKKINKNNTKFHKDDDDFNDDFLSDLDSSKGTVANSVQEIEKPSDIMETASEETPVAQEVKVTEAEKVVVPVEKAEAPKKERSEKKSGDFNLLEVLYAAENSKDKRRKCLFSLPEALDDEFSEVLNSLPKGFKSSKSGVVTALIKDFIENHKKEILDYASKIEKYHEGVSKLKYQ